MPTDLVQPFANLGSTGLAMLLLWWVYRDTSARLDKKDEAFRQLEKEVRSEITAQLISSTATNVATQRVMERVLDKLDNK